MTNVVKSFIVTVTLTSSERKKVLKCRQSLSKMNKQPGVTIYHNSRLSVRAQRDKIPRHWLKKRKKKKKEKTVAVMESRLFL